MSDIDRLYGKLENIESKLEKKFDRFETRLDSVERELIVYNEELKYHIEGTRQVMAQNEKLQDYIDLETAKLHKDFEPIKVHIEKLNNFVLYTKNVFNLLLKLLGVVSVIMGIYAKYKGII